MSFIYSEQKVNSAGEPIVSTAEGTLPAISGANLFSLPQQATSIASNFDTYKVVNISSNTTAAEETLYLVEGSCTINLAAPTAFGKRVAFMIVNNSATLTLVCNVGSGGTGLRMCISGLQYGNALGNTNTAYGYAGTTTYTLTGIGRSLEFLGFTGSLVYGFSSWLERSNMPLTRTNATGAVTPASVPVGFSESSVTNLYAPVTSSQFVMNIAVNLGTAARYLGNPVLLNTTGTSATQGATVSPTIGYTTAQRGNMPVRWIYSQVGLSGVTTIVRTAKMTINLTNISSSSSYYEQPIILRLDGRGETFAAGDLYPAGLTYEFIDTTPAVTFQQIRIDASTTVNALNVFDYYRAPAGTTVPSRVTGIEIWYNKSLKKWFLIRQILKGNI